MLVESERNVIIFVDVEICSFCKHITNFANKFFRFGTGTV